MLVPDVLVCSVGTEIFFESAGEADAAWAAELDQGWDRQGALDVAAGISELAPQVGVTRLVPTCLSLTASGLGLPGGAGAAAGISELTPQVTMAGHQVALECAAFIYEG